MKFHLTIATNTATTAYTFEDKASALERYHSELSYGYNQKMPYILCHLIDEDGKLVKSEFNKYVAPEPTPEDVEAPLE